MRPAIAAPSERGDDEEPELDDRVGAGEDADADRAGRVDRGAGGAIEAKWIIASARPMASGPSAALTSLRSSVTARMTQHEDGGHQHLEQQGGPPGVAGALVAEGVLAPCCPRRRSPRSRASRPKSTAPASRPPRSWAADVDADLAPRQAAAEDGAERDGRVEVAAGDAADGVGHDEDGEAEGQAGGDVVAAAAARRRRTPKKTSTKVPSTSAVNFCPVVGVSSVMFAHRRAALQSHGGRTPRRPRAL